MGKRAGRKRQTKREPSGRPQREHVGDVMAVVRSQPHRRGLSDAIYRDQKGECEIGRLYLHDRITPVQYDAAVAYRADAARMRRAIDAGTLWARGANLTGEGSRAAREIDEATAARWRRAYAEAYGALHDGFPGAVATEVSIVVSDVVARDQPVGDRLGLLCLGLNRLAEHYNLRKARNAA